MNSTIRKIQLTGGSTYIVSLPSAWIKDNRLSKGSEVRIEYLNGDIIVSSNGSAKKENTKMLRITGKVDLTALDRTLTSLYIANFDTIIVKNTGHMEPTLRDEIRRFSKLVMGVEIFEESSDTIVLQNVLDSSSFPIPNAIRRMSLNVTMMIADVIEAIKRKDEDLFRNIIDRDDDVDRYQWYIYREVRKNGSDRDFAIFYLIVSRILERIADHAVNICKLWLENRSEHAVNAMGILDALESSFKLYQESMEAFYSRNYAVLNTIIGKKTEILNLKREKLNSFKSEENVAFLATSVEEVSRIGQYATDIAELAMDMILSDKIEITI
ncbi:MAG: PhoU domain-containing protein [Thermoplasmataceae archaeon]